MKLGERIKQRREELGLRQVDVARLVKIKQPSLSLIESGETESLRAATLMGLAKALKTTPKWIMTGKGSHDPDPIQTAEDERMLEAWLSLSDPGRRTALLLLESLAKGQEDEPKP